MKDVEFRSLPILLKRLINGARHERNPCGASDGDLPLAGILKHTLAIHAHLGLDQANL